MSYIFVSYSQRDTEIAKRIVDYLNQHDIETWAGFDVQHGESFTESIQKAVDNASAGILILSVAAANSTYVTLEYRRLLALNKRLYIVKVDDIPIDEVHAPLLNLQYIDATADFDSAMQTLVNAIQNAKPLDSPTLRKAMSNETSDGVVLEVDWDNANSDKMVDMIKGLLDKGVRNIRITNG